MLVWMMMPGVAAAEPSAGDKNTAEAKGVSFKMAYSISGPTVKQKPAAIACPPRVGVPLPGWRVPHPRGPSTASGPSPKLNSDGTNQRQLERGPTHVSALRTAVSLRHTERPIE